MNDLIPPELMNKPFSQWQLDGVTAMMALMVLGRAWKSWKNGGGLKGVWRGFLLGTNVEKEPPKEEPPK